MNQGVFDFLRGRAALGAEAEFIDGGWRMEADLSECRGAGYASGPWCHLCARAGRTGSVPRLQTCRHNTSFCQKLQRCWMDGSAGG